jgi:cytochrome b
MNLHAHASSAAAVPANAASTASMTRRTVDAPTRTFHALFALSFLGAYLTAESEHLRLLHVTLGYTLAGLLAFRVVYGVFGPRQARLSILLRKLAALPGWLKGWQTTPLQKIDWRQGQNLAMPMAILTLLVLAVPLTASGYGSYNEWGDWLEDVHEGVGNAFLTVVLAHISLVVVLSVLRRKNLAMPMVTGRVPGAGPDLARHNHVWLAALLLVAVLAFGAWQWQQSPSGLVSPQALQSLLRNDGNHDGGHDD